MTNPDKKKYGVYSKTAYEYGAGLFEYKHVNGGSVIVTATLFDPADYKWSDAENRGEVTDFIRVIKHGSPYPRRTYLLIPTDLYDT